MEQLVPSCCVSCLRHPPPKLLEDADFLWIFWLYQKKGRNPRSLAQVLQENDHISHFFKEAEIIFGHINVKEESRRGKLWCSTQAHSPSPRKRQEMRAFNLEITPHLRLCNLIVYGKFTSYCQNRWWMDHLTSSLLCKCLGGRVAACAWIFSYWVGLLPAPIVTELMFWTWCTTFKVPLLSGFLNPITQSLTFLFIVRTVSTVLYCHDLNYYYYFMCWF